VFGIALGYEDLVDHDQLRHDPVLATLAGKLVANRVDYVFGLARNERLVGAIADSLALAEAESLAQGGPARPAPARLRLCL
jgi:hypothetical protein